MGRIVEGVDVCERNRFSTYVLPRDKEGLAHLHNWLAWFRADHIASAIILTDKGYALYREGMEEFLVVSDSSDE